MNVLKKLQHPLVKLSIPLSFALGNSLIGFLSSSWWFIVVGAYYAVLASARFCILNAKHKSGRDPDIESFVRRTTGILLIALSVCLIGINILSAIKDRGTEFHEIVMISIAAYSFTKITLAIIGMVQAKRCSSVFVRTLRNISLADSVVSIYSLQRSMLVSFPGMQPSDALLLNILTGTAVWMFVLLLGVNLLGGKCVVLAKSRLLKAQEKLIKRNKQQF